MPLALDLISRIEKGLRVSDLTEIVALAVALDVTPNRLMLTDESMSERVMLTPAVDDVDAPRAWAWATGDAPLGGSSEGHERFMRFAHENRPHTSLDQLTAQEFLGHVERARPAVEAVRQVIESGVPAEVVMAAVRFLEPTRIERSLAAQSEPLTGPESAEHAS